MKKTTRFICILLVFSLFLAIPAQAATDANTRASSFFSTYLTDLEKIGTNSFRIWFDVTANAAIMDELGVSEIALYRSADSQTWTHVRTYRKGTYPQMLGYNTGSHTGYVAYTSATPGYYYTARITFYAKNSTGIGERDIYTEIMRM